MYIGTLSDLPAKSSHLSGLKPTITTWIIHPRDGLMGTLSHKAKFISGKTIVCLPLLHELKNFFFKKKAAWSRFKKIIFYFISLFRRKERVSFFPSKPVYPVSSLQEAWSRQRWRRRDRGSLTVRSTWCRKTGAWAFSAVARSGTCRELLTRS